MPTLDWIGKKAVVNHHGRSLPPAEMRKKLSVGDSGAGTCWSRAITCWR